MNTISFARIGVPSPRRLARHLFSIVVILVFSVATAQASPNVSIWDTTSHLAEAPKIEDRSGWKIVPKNLFTLEADPTKAASDPGYSGREYSFTGDAVVENSHLIAIFSSAKGQMMVFAKDGAGAGRKVLEFSPRRSGSPAMTIRHCEIVRNVGDEAALEVTFSGGGQPDRSALFLFGRSEIVEIKPSGQMGGFTLAGPVDFGVVPSFVGDDLILSPGEFPTTDTIHLPVENLFLGLLKGEENMLVMTWPKGKQRLNLELANNPEGKRVVKSIDFDNDGQSLYLAAISAPGIWHAQELKSAYLEKDVAMEWKRPFPGKWVTQLQETTFKTSFRFRDSKSQLWRAVAGSYIYPVWFDGDNGYLHLSKKVPPKGQAIMYFREGDDTPLSVATPVDILRETLGRQLTDSIIDVEGRKLRTHHRRGGDGVHRACTCGCTEAIQAVFEAGDELEKKPYISDALGDMMFFVQQHVARIGEYRSFADSTLKFLKERETAEPELKEYLESLRSVLGRIPEEYEVQKENMKSPEYADELVKKTMALTGQKDPGNLKNYLELLKQWRGMGGAQDSFVGQCHVTARQLFQEAGYRCLTQPKALEIAGEIRHRCRQILRNPDGYEIWGDY